MNDDQENPTIKKITPDQFQDEPIIWVDYEDGTYRAIFINEN